MERDDAVSATAGPTLFWVIGTATNVGKTTVATALIRHLNASGLPALGFKPYVGGRLRDLRATS
ncbi:hypothetical protein [Allochromatium palmeri]|uniref:Uncharacterized protein n=1 Tax=Allochromatium palmeri TaxID=231048 RepID=A0A6N8EHC2_9GAMM|nr:hypothetical protein [Allochromatium palmeri]MTW23010.1 hypothetical protein [Allochromatium palmeri]